MNILDPEEYQERVNQIANIIKNEYGFNFDRALKIADKMMGDEELVEEFEYSVQTDKYTVPGKLIEGYSAKSIHELIPELSKPSIYAFMLDLKASPTANIKRIAKRNDPSVLEYLLVEY